MSVPERATATDGRPYFVNLAVRFESNMLVGEGSAATKYYVDEIWRLSRAATVVSGPVEHMKTSLCSNCGAPYLDSSERVCSSRDGRFGWRVNGTRILNMQIKPTSLTGYAPERGTNDRTLRHPRVEHELRALGLDDSAFSAALFIDRCRPIFMELYQGWNDDELARVRPYVSDSLFNYLRYWPDAYRQAGLENWVDDYAMGQCDIVKVVRDRHYDAITIRLVASGKDYTVDAKQRVVGGSAQQPRYFSEYWTMIRRAETRGAARVDKNCPSCGAELKISLAGSFAYCQAHVTSGEFDCVLSEIEQDESYRG